MDGNPMELLNKLISDPEVVNNIKDLIGKAPEKEADNNEGNKVGETLDSLPFIYEILNNKQNSEMIRKINKAYNGYADNKTPGLQLLDALKPYMSQNRLESLERVRKAIRISNAFSELKK